MERLTDRCWRNLDPWECCGQNFHCSRKLHDDGGCINGCIVPKLYRRLAEYEDLEEQGRLIKFDCSIGDTVYRINNVIDMIDSESMIYECKVTGIKKEFNSTYYYLHADIYKDNYSIWVDNWFDRCQIGHEFYLTKEEAEKALERLEKENVKRD